LQQDAQADTGPGDRNPDTGILCLAMMLQFHKMAADPSQLAHEFAPETAQPTCSDWSAPRNRSG